MDLKTSKKRKRKATESSKKRKRKAPELPEELVLEIFVRLPVKTLVRFKSVSKAWCAIISDPLFIRRHLHHKASTWEQNPLFLITPHALDLVIHGEYWPTTFCTQIRFYRWQQGASEARLMDGKHFHGEFNSVCHFAHCDGLVLVPTNTKVYLFNPATRDTMVLPESNRNKIPVPRKICLPVGLGLDPRTGRYKVVRAFFRSRDPLDVYGMGMEVYTIGGGADASWREIAADPPYPVVAWITAKSVNGFLFWVIDNHQLKPRPRCLLRLRLEDEAFGVTGLPDSLDTALDESFLLDEMHGKLCLTASSSSEPGPQSVMIWTLVDVDGIWEPRYSIDLTDVCHPMALLPGHGIMLQIGQSLYRYDLHTTELTILCHLEGLKYQRRRAGLKNIFFFNVIPYVESLARLTA